MIDEMIANFAQAHRLAIRGADRLLRSYARRHPWILCDCLGGSEAEGDRLDRGCPKCDPAAPDRENRAAMREAWDRALRARADMARTPRDWWRQ